MNGLFIINTARDWRIRETLGLTVFRLEDAKIPIFPAFENWDKLGRQADCEMQVHLTDGVQPSAGGGTANICVAKYIQTMRDYKISVMLGTTYALHPPEPTPTHLLKNCPRYRYLPQFLLCYLLRDLALRSLYPRLQND